MENFDFNQKSESDKWDQILPKSLLISFNLLLKTKNIIIFYTTKRERVLKLKLEAV